MFDRQKERQVRVPPERGDIPSFGKRTELPDEGVVGLVQGDPPPKLIFLGMVLPLGLEAVPQRVTDTNEPTQSLGGGFTEVGEQDEFVPLPSGQLAIAESERVRFHLLESRNMERGTRDQR